MGRYILTLAVFDVLTCQKEGAGEEIQLTDAINSLEITECIMAYHFDGIRYDVGEKLGFIKTSLEFALNRDDLRDSIMDYLKELLNEQCLALGGRRS